MLGLISFESLADSLRLSQTISVVWNCSSSMLTDSLQLVLMVTLALKICSFALALAYICWIGPGGCEFGPADCGVVQAKCWFGPAGRVAQTTLWWWPMRFLCHPLSPCFQLELKELFWLRQEPKESLSLSVCLSVRYKVLSSSFWLESSSNQSAVSHQSQSNQKVIRALKSESYSRSLKYCVLMYFFVKLDPN